MIEIVALSPDDGWAIVRTPDEGFELIRPPYRKEFVRPINEGEVDTWVRRAGLIRPTVEDGRAFESWNAVIGHLSYVVESTRGGHLDQDEIRRRWLRTLTTEELNGRLRRIRTELFEIEEFRKAKEACSELIEALERNEQTSAILLEAHDLKDECDDRIKEGRASLVGYPRSWGEAFPHATRNTQAATVMELAIAVQDGAGFPRRPSPG